MRCRTLIGVTLTVILVVVGFGVSGLATGQSPADPDFWMGCFNGPPKTCEEKAPPTTTVATTETVTVTAPTTTEPPPVPGVTIDQAVYTCNASSPKEFALIRLNANTDGNTLTLDPGCNNVVIHRIEIVNNGGGDCIKVRPPAPGATDVLIEGGYCITHGPSANHTDVLQAGAGLRITLRDVAMIGGCAGNCGNADFFTSGWSGGNPTDVVCEGCAFGPYDADELLSHGMNLGSPSLRSGARDTRICQGDYFAVTISGATNPVNEGNEIVLRSSPTYWAECSQAALLDYVGE